MVKGSLVCDGHSAVGKLRLRLVWIVGGVLIVNFRHGLRKSGYQHAFPLNRMLQAFGISGQTQHNYRLLLQQIQTLQNEKRY